MSAWNNVAFCDEEDSSDIYLPLERETNDGITRSALWDKDTFNDHTKFIKKINNSPDKGSRMELIQRLNNHLIRLGNDHRTAVLDPYSNPHRILSAINISTNKNKTTIYGCVKHAEFITEESTDRFYWMASGTSASASPLVIDKALNAENIRVSLKDTGFLFSNQNVIMEHGVFPTGIQDATIKEFGAFNNPSQLAFNQTLEWHNIIQHTNEYHEHKQNQTYYTATHATEIRPSNKN